MTIKTQNRNTVLDIIRIFALFSVVSVHSFSYADYYIQPINNPKMYIFTILRTFFMICVPLFIILSGYLMKNKTLSPKYYLGIVKTLSVYFIASVATYIFRIIYLKQNISIVGFAAGILDFTMVHYAWYVEMYIGLFLIIPFLNLIYNNLANKKQKQVLIATMIFLSAAPGIVNIWNFVTPGFFVTPSISNIYTQLIPDWWVDLYPLTYYFIGCYLREFGLNISRKNNIILIVLSALFWGIFNIYRCYPVSFVYGSWYDWGALPNVINSVLVFRLLLGINEKRIPLRMQKALAFLSGLTFGGYLM
ncbi:MAG: acyltransferase family protein, partial [Oscillospiraceae bacterium]|nr:acyltransferase family protein [Oscillospiraceae bacterium]